MYHFFVNKEQIFNEDSYINIIDEDVNHIKNVLRLKENSEIEISAESINYKCLIELLTNDEIRCKIVSKKRAESELPVKITLFQGLPKSEKFELIIQKCVELGVTEISPVNMERSIVKYDGKKALKKIIRWNSISKSAAKQSKRAIIPKINEIIKNKELCKTLENYDLVIVPYENEEGMQKTREIFKQIKDKKNIAIVIGPEGGFSDFEIDSLKKIGAETVTLGNRILRTETAGLACLSMISYEIEEE